MKVNFLLLTADLDTDCQDVEYMEEEISFEEDIDKEADCKDIIEYVEEALLSNASAEYRALKSFLVYC